MRTRHLSLVTHGHSDTPSVKPDVLSPYGPVRVGLITSQTTQSQQLSELLSSLESVVESLNYKSCTALGTLTTAIEAVRAALLPTQIDEAGTDVLE